MKIKIIQAKISDIDELMKWRMETLEHVFEPQNAENLQELFLANKKYYESSLANGSHVALFAQIGQNTVGCGDVCLYNEMPSPDNPNGKCAYLMNVYTKSSYRGQGVAAAVVKELISQAKMRKAGKIYLETSSLAKPLYLNLGFEDMGEYMILKRKDG